MNKKRQSDQHQNRGSCSNFGELRNSKTRHSDHNDQRSKCSKRGKAVFWCRNRNSWPHQMSHSTEKRPPFSFQFLFWRNDLGSVATTSCFCFEKKESTFEVVIVDMARCYWIFTCGVNVGLSEKRTLPRLACHEHHQHRDFLPPAATPDFILFPPTHHPEPLLRQTAPSILVVVDFFSSGTVLLHM